MNDLWQDLRYGARMLMKNPGFTLIAVMTLALGIGANTAIFTVVNAVLLRPLAYQEPERIMALWPDRESSSFQGVSESKFVFWRAQNQSFDSLAATQGVGSGINLAGGNEPEFVSGLRVSADFFRVLGVTPALGRGFTAEEDAPGGERVVILSHELWRRRFNADPAQIGRSISLNGNDFIVVGVLPAGFHYSERGDVLLPMQIDPATRAEGHNADVLGRLKPGVTQVQARADLQRVFAQFKAVNPGMLWRGERGIRAEPYLASLTEPVRQLLLILFGAVSCVLLIACANVANLQLTRAAGRKKELGIRLALGAGGWRLARQLVTEGVLLALLGGGTGLLFAVWGVEALVSLMPEGLIPRANETGFDVNVLVFTLGTAVLVGVLFALAPALRARSLDLNGVLKDGMGKGSTSGERGRLQSVLVVAEVALALMLLIGATLLLRTFSNLSQVQPGFDPHHVLTFEVAPNGTAYDTAAKQDAYFRRALERIKGLPGVESAAVTSNLPLGAWLNFGVGIAGKPDSLRSTEIRMITADYFNVMKMAVRRGRAFIEADNNGAAPVVIVNETFAKQMFPDSDPLGQTLSVQGTKVHQIVGVVNDVKQFSMRAESPATIFIPVSQVDDRVMRAARQFVTMKFAIRTMSEPLTLSGPIRQEMLKVDPTLPLAKIRSLEQIVAGSLAPERFNTLLLGLFASIGMVLAAVGIYGVISYSVALRTHEIGVRMALGAQWHDVLKLILKDGMLLVTFGIAFGLAGAFALTRVMKEFLFEISTTDPLTFTLVALLLVGVALLACYVPARRAARVDPMTALHCD